MTPEQKDLLLKDLCARLPYGVVIQEKCVEGDESFLPNKEGDRLVNIDAHADLLITNCGSWYCLEDIKPYLFPLSSMTDKQRLEYESLCIKVTSECGDLTGFFFTKDYYYDTVESIDYLYKNHFDIHNLIPIGLAKDATGLNIY